MRFAFHDPRVDPAPDGWAGFSRAARLHPVWDYEVMGLEAWGARNPQLLVVAAEGDELVAALSVMLCRPRLSPRFGASRTMPALASARRWELVALGVSPYSAVNSVAVPPRPLPGRY